MASVAQPRILTLLPHDDGLSLVSRKATAMEQQAAETVAQRLHGLRVQILRLGEEAESIERHCTHQVVEELFLDEGTVHRCHACGEIVTFFTVTSGDSA